MKCIDDYFNGNLTDAKNGAKRKSHKVLRDALIEAYGKSMNAAVAIADFLKGQGTYQAAADAEANEKG